MSSMTDELSPYARSYARFIEAGYSVITIIPGDKAPGAFRGGRWENMRDWTRFCDRRPTDFELRIWAGWPNAGMGICLGPASGNLVAIDLDYGSAEIRRSIEACLPPSPVRKVGAKGYTAFYRGDPNLASKVFRVYDEAAGAKVSVCEILARGRQTLLPPTIHPDTGRPYEWLTADTLDEMSVDDLPILTLDLADRIAAAIEPFGYEPEPQYVPASAGYAAGQDETIWRSLNNTALADLGAWVPALGLLGCRTTPLGYEAVASWRPSNSGRPDTQRKRNLKIASNGIRDFGDDRSYTPLDLVMASGQTTLDSAFEWLSRRVTAEEASIVLAPRNALPPHNLETGEIIEDAAEPAVAPPPAAVMPTVSEIADAEASAPPTAIDALDPRTAGGLLSEISDWMLANAWRPCPEFAVLGAVAFMSAIAGRRFVTPNGRGLNVYLMGIAGPGVGKDPVIKYPVQLLYKCQMANLIGPDDPSSDSAIEKGLRKCPAILMPIEEVGIFLQGVAHQRSGPWERKIRKLMLDLYTRSTDTFQGKTRAGEDDGKEPIQWPTMSIVGISNPNDFYNGITEANLSDGMIARMTFVAAKTKLERSENRSPLLAYPPTLVARIQGFVEDFPKPEGNLAVADWRNPDATKEPNPHVVPWASPEAETRWLEIDRWQLEVAERDPEMQGIVGRAAEQTSKFATMRAVSRNPSHPAVTVEDVEWGWSFVSGSIETVDAGVKAYLAGSEFERLHKVMFAAIKAAGGKGIAKSLLIQKRGVSKAEPRMRDAAVAYLEDAELIYRQENMPKAATGGRPGVKYLAIPGAERAA